MKNQKEIYSLEDFLMLETPIKPAQEYKFLDSFRYWQLNAAGILFRHPSKDDLEVVGRVFNDLFLVFRSAFDEDKVNDLANIAYYECMMMRDYAKCCGVDFSDLDGTRVGPKASLIMSDLELVKR